MDGHLERIPVGSILDRRTLELSAMPDNYSELPGNDQIADLAAFLMSCRHPSGEARP